MHIGAINYLTNQSQLAQYAGECVVNKSVDSSQTLLDPALLEQGHSLSSEPERNFSPALDQVSLRLRARSEISEICVNAGSSAEESESLLRITTQIGRPNTPKLSLTFPFHQNAGAQAEQRGETDPLH